MSDFLDNPVFDEDDDVSQNLITLMDEEGMEHEFEIVDMLDLEDNRYVALVPILEDEEDEDEEGELFILRADDDEDEEYLTIIEDEDEYAKVAKVFMERLSEEFEIEE